MLSPISVWVVNTTLCLAYIGAGWAVQSAYKKENAATLAGVYGIAWPAVVAYRLVGGLMNKEQDT